jgi:hypothetical protein
VIDKIKQLIQAVIGGVLPAELGKGPGFIGFAFYVSTIIAVLLAKFHIEGATVIAAFTPLIGAVYGAGMWKVHSDNQTTTKE